MRVVLCSSTADLGSWVVPLRAALPGAEVSLWDPAGPAVGAEAAVVWQPTAELLRRETGLRVLFNIGAGVDRLLALPELSPDIQVVRLEDAGMAVQMAEYVLHAVVRAARGLDRYEVFQREARWQPLAPIVRHEWPVGVMGLGAIGARVAATLAALDYPVAGWSRSGRAPEGVESFSGAGALPAFLARTRVLVNLLPLTPETADILDRGLLSQLLPGGHLVNVGRGQHLVEEDLLALLDAGRLAGATLDVFREEPLPAGHPFWRHPRIRVTPHVSATTLRDESIAQIARGFARYRAGQVPAGSVDRARGY